MQIQNYMRYIVWGMLAAVSYLMLVTWEKDYGRSSVTQSTAIQNTITQEYNDSHPTYEANTTNSSFDDIPQVESVVVTTEDTHQDESTVSKRWIRVTSDVLDIVIDLEGGDIIQVDLLQHAVDIESPDQSITLLQKDATRTYIAQSGLNGTDGPDANKEGRPLYQASKKEYKIKEGAKILKVPLIFKDENGIKVTKTFELSRNNYFIAVDYKIENQTNSLWVGNLFAQIKRDSSIDPLADTSLFAMKPFLGVAYWSPEQKYNKIDIPDISEEPVKVSHQAGWVAFVQHYFISAWVAPTDLVNTYQTRTNNKGENIIGFTSQALQIKQGNTGEFVFGFYAGPKDQNQLKTISDGLDLTVDYGWLWMIAQIIFALLIWIQSYVGNWGWSIVLLTCFIKLLFFPLNQYAFKSMANMRKLQPKMQRLKEQYGDDRQKLSQATMEMYRKEKINPLGSCLPMLVQMPVFISLYWVLSESVEIRHAPFIGWIEDLSIMDPYFVLPGLMAISMIVQQRLSPMVFQDPMQERIMKFMPVMFAVFFLFFPAGLVLYWLVNNILTIAQQWFINRSIDAK